MPTFPTIVLSPSIWPAIWSRRRGCIRARALTSRFWAPVFGCSRTCVHSPVDIRQDECDRIDQRLDVMSKTFLGLTVACARCHDHKFDAISQRDYYALSGFAVSGSYRQVRFETLERERQIAEELDRLREQCPGGIVAPGGGRAAAGGRSSGRLLVGCRRNFVARSCRPARRLAPQRPPTSDRCRQQSDRRWPPWPPREDSTPGCWACGPSNWRRHTRRAAHPLHRFALSAAGGELASRLRTAGSVSAGGAAGGNGGAGDRRLLPIPRRLGMPTVLRLGCIR